MAEIGCLGDVVFTVSPDKILTPGTGASWSSSVKWSEHDRHLKSPALEYTGLGADQMKLQIRLSKSLGVDPMRQIWDLFDYERRGDLLPLTIGSHAYGMYRWVIESAERTLECFDGKGDLLAAEVTLNLKGYVQ